MVPLRLWANADITTFDRGCPRAAALVTAGPTVLAVGDDDLADAWRSRVDEVIDLGGHSVLPGLTDSHIHFIEHGLTMRLVALEACGSAAEVVETVRDSARGDGWVVGVGFQVNRWTDGVAPHRSLLDAHFPERPVVLHSRCLHQMWVNSAALRLAGVTRDTPDPEGGVIARDADGDPTGLLQEEANDLIHRVVPKPTEEELRDAVHDATQDLWSHGVTAVHAPEGAENLRLLGRLHQVGALHMRTLYLPPFSLAEDLVRCGQRSGLGDRRLRMGGLKVFLDGSLGSATALMHAPYQGSSDNVGVETLAPDAFREMVEFAHAHGWSMAVHAIGDLAVDRAVDTLAASQTAHGIGRDDPGPWDRIEHFQCLSPGTPERAGRARVAAMMQPIHLFDDWAASERLWGLDRSHRAYACRSLVDAGVPVALGSDSPVASGNPWWDIHAAITRTDLGGSPAGGWHPEQRLTADEALRGRIVAPALVAGEHEWRGRLAPGCIADFVVVSHDPHDRAIDWREMSAEMTVVDGAVVFDRHSEHRFLESPRLPRRERGQGGEGETVPTALTTGGEPS